MSLIETGKNNQMEKTFAKVEELADNLKEYVNTRIEKAKLRAAEKTSHIVAHAVAAVIVTVVVLFFIVFASIALSLLLGEWIGKEWAGFLIVAGIYLLIAIIVWLTRKQLIQVPIMNSLIRQIFSKETEDEED
jgi:hypothetical protein